MSLYAGMDWSSYSKPHRQIFGAAIVVVSDLEVLASVFQEARGLGGLPKEHIFHAYTDAPEIQLMLLQLLVQTDIALRVGALIYDSAEGVPEIVTRMSANEFTHYMGINLLKEFLPVCPVTKLVADSELQGKKQETKFKKEIRRQRDLGFFSHAPEIEFSGSKKSELIQLADLFAYNLYRSQRDALELPVMRELVKRIRKDSRNHIWMLAEIER